MVDVIKGKDANCKICKKFGHLMPYGPDGTYICFACGMKDESGTRVRYLKLIEGKNVIIDYRENTEN
jgi:hypothetical protein